MATATLNVMQKIHVDRAGTCKAYLYIRALAYIDLGNTYRGSDKTAATPDPSDGDFISK